MSHGDAHVQHTWQLIRDGDGDEVTIELWTDEYSVRVHGGDDEESEGGRADVDRLLAQYTAAGYRAVRDYPVNAPVVHEEPVEEGPVEPDNRPEKCPQCGAPVEYEPNYGHPDGAGEGPAWLCTVCKWGEWVTV